MSVAKLFLSDYEWADLCAILAPIQTEIFAYGSRVKGTHQPFSDIDLLVMDDLSDIEIADIKEQFDNSHLPMKVDLKRRKDISDTFFESIKQDLSKIPPEIS